MYLNVRNTLAALALLAIAAGSWYWSRPPAPLPEQRAGERSVPTGYYLSGARLLGTDDTGHLVYSVYAEHVEELSGQQRLVLTQVRVEYRPTEGIAWVVRAASATTPKDGEFLDLEGAVELRSESADGTGEITIETDRLRLEPNRFIARSEQPVRISIGEGLLGAGGMTAYLKDDRLELESNVHGQFFP
jgi:lipopolysaccharide export system protein LptC